MVVVEQTMVEEEEKESTAEIIAEEELVDVAKSRLIFVFFLQVFSFFRKVR